MPQQENPSASSDVNKALAQQYFADILPDEPAQERAAPAPEPANPSEKSWSAEDDIPEEDKQLQRELLFQYAQETAPQPEKTHPLMEDQAEDAIEIKKVKREKKWQRVCYWVLLSLVFLLPALRIFLSRYAASIEQFNWMQPQIVPSFLYCIEAVILLFPLLRRTAKPRPVTAAVLLIPFIFDFWYLLPGARADVLLNVSSLVKIAVSVFAVAMSSTPRKHPAL